MNWLWVRGSRMETRKFCKVGWMSVEKKMRILVGEEDSFYEPLVAHTWLSDYFDPGK